MLPTRDAALLARGAERLHGAVRAEARPIAAYGQSAFFARVTVGETRASRADIDVLIGEVAEVLLAKPALRLGPRGQGLGQGDRDPDPFASQDLLAVEVAAVRHHIQFVDFQGGLGLLGHRRELGAVVALVDDLMGDDQVVLSIDGGLDIVADHAGTPAGSRHGAGIGVRQ